MTDELRNVVLFNAPYIIAETSTYLPFYGPTSGTDHLLPVDFDNDLQGRNNWSNAIHSYIPNRIPTVYYSIQETGPPGTGFYYIGYYFYHPRDGGFTIGPVTHSGHEHDMEGVFFIVRKVSYNPYGVPVLAWSEAHGNSIPYFNPALVDPNTALSQGNATTWGGEIVLRYDGSAFNYRPVVAIAASTHGTYMAQACGPGVPLGGHRDGYGYNTTTSDPIFAACIHQNRSWILYRPALDRYAVGLADNVSRGSYDYRLVELATSPVWLYRAATASKWLFAGEMADLPHGERGLGVFAPSSGHGEASPPWAWLGGGAAGGCGYCLGYAGWWYSFGQDGTIDGESHPTYWPNWLPGELLFAPQDAARRFFPNYGWSGYNEPVVFNAFYAINPAPPQIPQLTVSINGPDIVWSGHSASWSASVSYGTPPYTYYWTGQNIGKSNQSTFGGTVYNPFTLYLDVWDAAGAHVAITKDIATSDCWPTVC